MNKKILFTLGTTITVATPIVTAISCSSNKTNGDLNSKIESEKNAIKDWFNLSNAQEKYEIDFRNHLTKTWKDISSDLVIALGQSDIDALNISSQIKYQLKKKETEAMSTKVQYTLALGLVVDGDVEPIDAFTITLTNEAITDIENVDSRKIANEILEAVEESFSSNESATIETLSNYTSKFRKEFTPEIANAIGIVGQFPTLPEGGQILYTMYFDALEENEKVETTIKFWGSMNGFLSTDLHFIEFESSNIYKPADMPEISDQDIANASFTKFENAYTFTAPTNKTIDILDSLIAESDVKFEENLASIFGLTGEFPQFVKNGYIGYTFIPNGYNDDSEVTYTLEFWGKKDNIRSQSSLKYQITSSDKYKTPVEDDQTTNPNKDAANAAFEKLKDANFKYSETPVSPDYMWLFNEEFRELLGTNKKFTKSLHNKMELSGDFPSLGTGSSAVYTLMPKGDVTIMQRVKYDLKIWGVHGGVKSDEYIQIEMTSYDEAYMSDYPDMLKITNAVPRGLYFDAKSLEAVKNASLEHSVFKKYDADIVKGILKTPDEYTPFEDYYKNIAGISGVKLEFRIALRRWELNQEAFYWIEYKITHSGVTHIMRSTIVSDKVGGDELVGDQKDIEEIRSNLQDQKVPMHSTVSVYKLDEIVDSFGNGQGENNLPTPTGPQSFDQAKADALGIGLTLPSDLKGATLKYELFADMPMGNYGTYILMIYITKGSHTTEVKHFFLSADELLEYSR